jgi:hypothetical protein
MIYHSLSFQRSLTTPLLPLCHLCGFLTYAGSGSAVEGAILLLGGLQAAVDWSGHPPLLRAPLGSISLLPKTRARTHANARKTDIQTHQTQEGSDS